MVALAKASSLAAAAIACLAAGFVIYLSGSLNETIPRQDALTAAVSLAAAVAAHLRRTVPGVLLPGAEHPRPRHRATTRPGGPETGAPGERSRNRTLIRLSWSPQHVRYR